MPEEIHWSAIIPGVLAGIVAGSLVAAFFVAVPSLHKTFWGVYSVNADWGTFFNFLIISWLTCALWGAPIGGIPLLGGLILYDHLTKKWPKHRVSILILC